jgi:hypothetical protein
LQQSELREVAPVKWQIRDVTLRDRLAERVRIAIHCLRYCGHLDPFGASDDESE